MYARYNGRLPSEYHLCKTPRTAVGAVRSKNATETVEFFLNVFTEFSKFGDKKFAIKVKGLEPATSCVRDQDATTVPARHV